MLYAILMSLLTTATTGPTQPICGELVMPAYGLCVRGALLYGISSSTQWTQAVCNEMARTAPRLCENGTLNEMRQDPDKSVCWIMSDFFGAAFDLACGAQLGETPTHSCAGWGQAVRAAAHRDCQ